MTIKSSIFHGLLAGLKANVLTKWGGGLRGVLTGSVGVAGQLRMNYLIRGGISGSGLADGAMDGAVSGSLAGSGVASGGLASQYTLDTLTPAAIAAITGEAAPTLMWRGGDSSGATELVVGTDDLSDAGSPLATKLYADATLDGTTTKFTKSNTTQACVAAGTGVADIGSETLTIIHICSGMDSTAAETSVFGKRYGTSPHNGYEALLDPSEYMDWNVDGPGGHTLRSVAVDHNTADAHVMAFTRSITDDLSAVWTRLGSSTGSVGSVNGTMTNTQTFAIGKVRKSPAAQSWGMTAVWIGSDGDFGAASGYEAARLAIAEALGYE